MAVKLNKKAKVNETRKNAEALKAKKKDLRNVKSDTSAPRKLGAKMTKAVKGTKGKSLVGQAKRKN